MTAAQFERPPALRFVLSVLACAATFAWGARAAADAALVVHAGGVDHEYTEETLASLPQVTITTEHEFADGPVAYRGPLVRDVLETIDLGEAETLRFIAANDYFIDIPTSDFQTYDVILAMEADGRKLSRREKGPLWLMYPISDHDELRDPVYIHRLIWQLVRIEPLR